MGYLTHNPTQFGYSGGNVHQDVLNTGAYTGPTLLVSMRCKRALNNQFGLGQTANQWVETQHKQHQVWSNHAVQPSDGRKRHAERYRPRNLNRVH